MPQQVTIGDQQVTVYTDAEMAAAREQARAGLVTAAERDTAAAAARREAEAATATARAEALVSKQAAEAAVAEVATQKTAAETAAAEAAAVKRTLLGVRVLASEINLPVVQAEQLLALPCFVGVDLADEGARKGALDAFKATFPQLVPAAGGAAGGNGAAFGGAGGSATGGGGAGAPDLAAVEKMSQVEYEKARLEGKVR